MARIDIETTCRTIEFIDGDAWIDTDAGLFVFPAGDNLKYSGVQQSPKAYLNQGVVVFHEGDQIISHMVKYAGMVSARELAGMWGGNLLR